MADAERGVNQRGGGAVAVAVDARRVPVTYWNKIGGCLSPHHLSCTDDLDGGLEASQTSLAIETTSEP